MLLVFAFYVFPLALVTVFLSGNADMSSGLDYAAQPLVPSDQSSSVDPNILSVPFEF